MMLKLAIIAAVFFISLPADSAKASCPDSSWVHKFGSCYKFIHSHTHPKNWRNAKADCEKRGAHLVTINSKEENNFILQIIKEGLPGINNEYGFFKFSWIGANVPESDNKNPELDDWEWVQDRSKLDFSNWARNQPFLIWLYKVARIDNRNGKWSANNREMSYPYICEKNI